MLMFFEIEFIVGYGEDLFCMIIVLMLYCVDGVLILIEFW